MWHEVRTALRNGAHHWECWAFGLCCPAAVGVRLCVCVHVSECFQRAQRPLEQLLQRRVWRRAPTDKGTRKLGRKKGFERHGMAVLRYNSLYGHLMASQAPWDNLSVSPVFCSSTVARTQFIYVHLRFTAWVKGKFRSMGCEKCRAWAHWRDRGKKKRAKMAPRWLTMFLWRVLLSPVSKLVFVFVIQLPSSICFPLSFLRHVSLFSPISFIYVTALVYHINKHLQN